MSNSPMPTDQTLRPHPDNDQLDVTFPDPSNHHSPVSISPLPILSILSASFGSISRINHTQAIIDELDKLHEHYFLQNQSLAYYNDTNHIIVLSNFQDEVHSIHSGRPINTLSKMASSSRLQTIQEMSTRVLSFKTRNKVFHKKLAELHTSSPKSTYKGGV
ncbi:hypothetical protein C1645_817922 [Glomus cerebriforme]|uniref:Uncharacterized protein n=1 Tax=Glomus cerebriforme TaxID=658196 RepID=A0A397TB26_9GLOM|nr:hypothetical protein C1645_817922 [Glomus cerebriforme]